MEDNKIRNSAISNLAWRFAERCGAQGVAFIVSIVLARILSPDTYGTIALITVFTNILNVFIHAFYTFLVLLNLWHIFFRSIIVEVECTTVHRIDHIYCSWAQ